MRNLKSLLFLAVLALLVSACEFSVSTANFADAFMAADSDGAQRTTSYTQDAVFYAIVDLANAPDDTEVKATWIAVNAEGVEPEFVIDEVTLTSSDARLTFDLTNAPDTLWPLGDYRVDLYLNGELETSLAFQVQ
jgi:hypothetical protein